MAWLRLAGGTVVLSPHPVRWQRVLAQTGMLLKDSQVVRVLQHFHFIAAGSGDPVIISTKGDITILVRASLVRLVGSRKMLWQLVQVVSLVLEGFRRNQMCLGLRPMLHAFGSPLACLRVEVFQRVEDSSGEKVRFHGPKTTFVTRFSIWMIDRMADELKAVTSGEGVHLGSDHRSAARPS